MSRHHHHRHNPFSPDHESKAENEQRDTTMAEETKEQETIKRNREGAVRFISCWTRSRIRRQPGVREIRREGVTRGTDSSAESSSEGRTGRSA